MTKTTRPNTRALSLALLLLGCVVGDVNAQPFVVTNITVPYGSVVVNSALNMIYISGGQNDAPTTAVFDGATLSNVTSVTGWGVGVDVTNNNFWVGNVYAGDAIVRAGATDATLTSLNLSGSVGYCPMGVSVDAPHRVAWVGAQCGADNDPIWAVNADTFAIIAGPIGSGGIQGQVVVNPATGRLYINPSGVSKRVNPSTFAVKPNAFGYVVAANAPADLLYAVAENTNTTLQILSGAPDPEVLVTNITLPAGYAALAVNPALNRLYVGCGANTILVLNASTGQSNGIVSLGAGITSIETMDVDVSRGLVYAVAYSGGSNYLYVLQDDIIEGGAWTEEAPMPASVPWSVAGAMGNMVYVAGGNNGEPMTNFYGYNPASNSWSTLPSLPAVRYQMDGPGVISNKLYVTGGWTYDPPLPNNNLWVYDPVAQTWSSLASLPLLSADGAGGVMNNKYYVTTPDDGYDGYYNFLHVYDPASNAWTVLASSPASHSAPGYGVIGTKLYVAGGQNINGTSAQLDVYDSVSNTWTTMSPMPAPRYGCGSAVVNGLLYVFGGTDGTNTFNSTVVYDPASDTWAAAPPMITARSALSGASLNGVIYAFSGQNNTNNLLNTEAYATFAQTGSLQVTITPSGAVSNGAQWQVDGGTLQSSGATVSNLSVGEHTVSFSAINGWITPSNQTVSVTSNASTSATGAYVAETGSLQVTIVPAALAGAAYWSVDGGATQSGDSTLANLTVGAHTVSFQSIVGWSTPPALSVIIAQGVATPLTGAYSLLDEGKPTLTITSPKAGEGVSNANFVVTGTAKDSVALAAVDYQLNGGSWMQAVTSNGWSNWSASVNLAVGANTFSARAIATSGNESAVSTVDFKYILSAQLALQTSGHGKVTPDDNGALLAINVNYTLKAVPAVDNLFSNWVGGVTPPYSVLSTNASYTFKMQSNLVLQANFVPSPFVGPHGVYNGLFAEPTGATEETAGMLSDLNLGPLGAYSGKLLIGGQSFTLSSGFNLLSQAREVIPRSAKEGGPLVLAMALDDSVSPPYIAGTVSGTNGGGWIAALVAEQAATASSSAAYTMLVSPNAAPPGYGYILMTNHAGAVALSGALADGTSFSQAVPLLGAGDVPIYGNLYGGTGLLWGWLRLESGTPSGSLTWIKKASHANLLYTNGFTNVAGLVGSRWINPAAKIAVIDFPAGAIDLTGGGLPAPLSFEVAVSANNTLVEIGSTNSNPTNSFSGSINPKTGLLTITFGNGNGNGKATTAGTGAVLQNANSGAGFFLGKTNAGAILLQP